jgi:hypothetical protein
MTPFDKLLASSSPFAEATGDKRLRRASRVNGLKIKSTLALLFLRRE